MTEQELRAYIEAIRPADEAAMDAARRRQAQLAKPPGSLGQLEDMSIRLAGVTGQVCPAMGKCRVAVFAADNGVVAEGVSCTPPSVTLQQAVNMTFRKTGMSAHGGSLRRRCNGGGCRHRRRRAAGGYSPPQGTPGHRRHCPGGRHDPGSRCWRPWPPA